MSSDQIDPRAPSFEHLFARARRRMPGFAFDYLSGGCMSEVNLERNTRDIREVQLQLTERDRQRLAKRETGSSKARDAYYKGLRNLHLIWRQGRLMKVRVARSVGPVDCHRHGFDHALVDEAPQHPSRDARNLRKLTQNALLGLQ